LDRHITKIKLFTKSIRQKIHSQKRQTKALLNEVLGCLYSQIVIPGVCTVEAAGREHVTGRP